MKWYVAGTYNIHTKVRCTEGKYRPYMKTSHQALRYSSEEGLLLQLATTHHPPLHTGRFFVLVPLSWLLCACLSMR